MSQSREDDAAQRAHDARLDERLARIEHSVGELAARLRAVEDELAHTRRAPQREAEARPFGQGAPPPHDAQATGNANARAINDASAPATNDTNASAFADVIADANTRVRDDASANANARTDSTDAHAHADGSATVEDYPFNIPPRVAEETDERAPFSGSQLGAARVAGQQDRRAGESASSHGAHESSSHEAGASGTAKVRAPRDLETLVGGSLFNWVGIIAATLGVGFFLKYAFENQWIGPTGRVLLGAAAGCALLALAERLRARGYRSYAHVLAGGGILILYLSTYAARVFYDLVPLPVGFALMSVVTATAVALAVRYDALSIAVLALIGGFLTPLLLSTHTDKQIALFAYIAFLDAGVLAVAYFKRWRVVDHLAFVATVLTFAAWAIGYYDESKDARTFFFLTLFFLMFAALPLLHNTLRRRASSVLDISLLVTNSALYFGAAYLVLHERHDDLLGAFAFLVALFHALLYLFAHTRHAEDRKLASAYVVAVASLLLVAIGTQFERQWTTIGWAAEALALTWFGLRANERAARYTSLVVFAVALEHWFMIDLRDFAFGYAATFTPLLNARALSCAGLVAALASTVYLYRRRADAMDKDEREIIAAVLILAANALALTLLSCDALDYFSSLATFPDAGADQFGTRVQMLHNNSVLTLTLLWAVYAVLALMVGLRRNVALLRYAALAWLAATGVKILLRDASFYDATWHAPLFNQTFAAFAIFVGAIWYASHAYARAQMIDERERRRVRVSLAVVGNLFAVAALSLEASGYFRKQLDARERAGTSARDLRLARQLSLSLVWAIYGGVMLAYGHVRQNRALRLLALALLAATALKVFLLDLSELETFYRIVSFIALGVVLLAVSFLYQQRQKKSMKSER